MKCVSTESNQRGCQIKISDHPQTKKTLSMTTHHVNTTILQKLDCPYSGIIIFLICSHLLLGEKKNLFGWEYPGLIIPWALTNFPTDIQSNRPFFDSWPLCGNHACTDIRNLLFLGGVDYHNGIFNGNKSFEDSVQITTKPNFIFKGTPIYVKAPFFFLLTNEKTTGVNNKLLHTRCLLEY